LFGEEKRRLASTVALKFFKYMVEPFESKLALKLRSCVVNLEKENLEKLFDIKAVKQEYATRRTKMEKVKQKLEKNKKYYEKASLSFYTATNTSTESRVA